MKVPKNYADKCIFEVNNEIYNEQIFGNFPDIQDLEYSAIIGYVTVSGYGDDSTSVWANPVTHQWHIEDAYIFDEPIRNVKCKLGLFVGFKEPCCMTRLYNLFYQTAFICVLCKNKTVIRT